MSIRKPILALGVAGAIALAAVATPALAQSDAPDIAMLPMHGGSGANPPPPPWPIAGEVILDTPASWQGELLSAPLARPIALLAE